MVFRFDNNDIYSSRFPVEAQSKESFLKRQLILLEYPNEFDCVLRKERDGIWLLRVQALNNIQCVPILTFTLDAMPNHTKLEECLDSCTTELKIKQLGL
jgi:hypothetical protein